MIDIPDFVFPTDEQGQKLCPRCKKTLTQCDCPDYKAPKVSPKQLKPLIRLDKSGRKGKVVTVIEALPPDEKVLKDLSKVLKVKTGSGGTYYVDGAFGVIEIQGDHREVALKILNDCKSSFLC